MALGSGQQNANQLKEREMYSRLRFYNASSTVDPSTFQYSMLFGMLVVKIAPLMPGATAENAKYDYDNQGTVFLTVPEAYILLQEINQFLADPEAYNNVGSVHKKDNSLLSISNGKEFNITNPCLVLRKINDNGSIAYTYVYEFVGDYYAIRNFDPDTAESQKFYYGLLELQLFALSIDQYIKGQTYGIAYSINDANRYERDREYKQREDMCKALGISTGSGQSSHNNGVQGRNPMFNQGSSEPKDASEINNLL